MRVNSRNYVFWNDYRLLFIFRCVKEIYRRDGLVFSYHQVISCLLIITMRGLSYGNPVGRCLGSKPRAGHLTMIPNCGSMLPWSIKANADIVMAEGSVRISLRSPSEFPQGFLVGSSTQTVESPEPDSSSLFYVKNKDKGLGHLAVCLRFDQKKWTTSTAAYLFPGEIKFSWVAFRNFSPEKYLNPTSSIESGVWTERITCELPRIDWLLIEATANEWKACFCVCVNSCS